MKNLFEALKEAEEKLKAKDRKKALENQSFVAGLAGLGHHFEIEYTLNLFLTEPAQKPAFLTELAALGKEYDAAVTALARKHFGENNVRSGTELEALHPLLRKTLQKVVGADVSAGTKPVDNSMRSVFESMLSSPNLTEEERQDMQRDFDAMYGSADDMPPDALALVLGENGQPENPNN